MATPTGTISLNDVNVELGNPGTTSISLNDSSVRNLAGVPSGTISMNNLRNKSAAAITVSPSIGGQSVIPLSSTFAIGSYGEYTISSTSGSDLTVDIKMWGAGASSGRAYDNGGNDRIGSGGGGGATTGRIVLRGGSSYIIRIGQKGGVVSGTNPGATYLAGGQGGAPSNTQGAGYSGIFKSSVSQQNALLIAGGGGGGGDSAFGGQGGAGGGTSGQGSSSPGNQGGGGGTQSAGGAAALYNGATVGLGLLGGKSGNAGGAVVAMGGGGGGYFGGGGGNVAGGGGGSGYVNSPHSDVVSGTTYTGLNSTAALSSDSDRGGAGQGMIGYYLAATTQNTDGRIVISKV